MKTTCFFVFTFLHFKANSAGVEVIANCAAALREALRDLGYVSTYLLVVNVHFWSVYCLFVDLPHFLVEVFYVLCLMQSD